MYQTSYDLELFISCFKRSQKNYFVRVGILPSHLKHWNMFYYLLPLELLYRDIQNLDITNQKKKFLKTRIKD